MSELETGFRIGDVVAVIRRRLPIVVVAAVVGLVAGYVVFSSAPESYSATSRVQVRPIKLNAFVSDGKEDPVDIATEKDLVKSDQVADNIRKELGLKGENRAILGRVTVTTEPDSLVLKMTYVGDTAAQVPTDHVDAQDHEQDEPRDERVDDPHERSFLPVGSDQPDDRPHESGIHDDVQRVRQVVPGRSGVGEGEVETVPQGVADDPYPDPGGDDAPDDPRLGTGPVGAVDDRGDVTPRHRRVDHEYRHVLGRFRIRPAGQHGDGPGGHGPPQRLAARLGPDGEQHVAANRAAADGLGQHDAAQFGRAVRRAGVPADAVPAENVDQPIQRDHGA